ncbi:MAG TPA: maltose alpha-D-glucosyltransferase [Candidatus Xenobia bacterium]|jgi:trehalose synthase
MASRHTTTLVLASVMGACCIGRPALADSTHKVSLAPPAPKRAAAAAPATEGPGYVQWLESQSMLHQAERIGRRYMASREQWLHPYGLPQSKVLSGQASVWFAAYPAATITRPGENILHSLGDPGLWKAFQDIGVEAIHLGPMELAGGVTGRHFTPTVDGGFDRIGIRIDPFYGTDADFRALSKTAKAHGAMVAGDIIPGHTGKGPDFRLAERDYKDYPGIYNMIEVKKADWGLLPPVPAGQDTVNVPPDAVEKLYSKGYVVGKLERVIFLHEEGKESNWSCTAPVMGTDGVTRRWVYLHYFKAGQPTLDWLDPSMAAQRLIGGDVLNSLQNLGATIVRLDANGFLGLERTPGSDTGWSEGHPLSLVSSNLIAMMVRKYGGYTFQELNLTFDDIKKFSEYGPDLSYDFVTRPGYIDAVLTGDGSFLRLLLHLEHDYKIDPSSLIHALQNHDELTMELVHFTSHGTQTFALRGQTMTGKEVHDVINKEVRDKAVHSTTYNRETGNGVATTLTGICAAAFGIKDPYHMSPAEKEMVKKGHFLMALYNAMQPGVMALSGWDLLGALPVPADQVKALVAGGDNRWINRGAYDLMGYNPTATKAGSGLPRTLCLYGSLSDQLKDPNSFASMLKHALAIRKQYKINLAEQVDIPEVSKAGLVVMVHRLPDNGGIEVTALNFSREPLQDVIKVPLASGLASTELLSGAADARASASGDVAIALDGLQGKVLLFR